MLQLSIGRMSGGAVALAAVVAAVVLGIVLYGWNAPHRTEQAPPTPHAQSARPRAGAKRAARRRERNQRIALGLTPLGPKPPLVRRPLKCGVASARYCIFTMIVFLCVKCSSIASRLASLPKPEFFTPP